MRPTPYLLFQIDVWLDRWMLDPNYGPKTHTVEELAEWLAESCEREWCN